MKEISGYISDIRFKAEDSNFMIFDVVCGNVEYTCKGNVPPASVGANVEIRGDIVMAQGYGEQILVSECIVSAPTDIDGLKYYLGSGAIHGIGETMAARIVDAFGTHTMDILENEPERLAEVKGISERKARDIAVQFREKSETRAAMMFMQKYGISGNLSKKIYIISISIYPGYIFIHINLSSFRPRSKSP